MKWNKLLKILIFGLIFAFAISERIKVFDTVGDDIYAYKRAIYDLVSGVNPYKWTVESFSNPEDPSNHGFAYLPGLMYVNLIGYIIHVWSVETIPLEMLWKIPILLADLGTGILLILFFKDKGKYSIPLTAFSLLVWFFNPYFYSKDNYVYTDPLPIFFMFLSLYLLEKKSDLSAIFYAFAVSLKTFPIILLPKKDSAENAITITAKSGQVDVFDSGGILYLNDSACYGFGMNVEKEFEGRIGEGERRKITFSNNGQAEMGISIASNQQWVYFEPQSLIVPKGGTGFVNYYITPPFDFLGETKKVTLAATNNFGLSLEKQISLNVTGPWFGLVPANGSVKAQATNTQQENGEKALIVEFELKNESPQEIEIKSIEAKGITAAFGIESKNLAQGETAKVTMKTTIKEGEASAGARKQEIAIDTSEGMLVRTLEFEVSKETPIVPAKEESQATGLTGLLSFSNAQTILGLILIVIVGGLLIYYIISNASGGKEAEKEEPKEVEAKEVAALEKLHKKTGAKKTVRGKKPKNSRARK